MAPVDNETSADFGRDLPPPTRRWLELSLIFIVFFIAGGAPAPHVNEAYYLTKAKHYWQPEWCAGDLFLESADAHVVFCWTVGWLTKLFSLSTVAWIGRVAAWLLLAVGWQALSHRVVDQPYLSVLSAMLWVALVDWTNFAGEWVVGGVEGKCFAYAAVLVALASVAAARWRAALLWLGLASAFHVLVGGWSAIAAGYVWLREPRARRPGLVQLAPALALGGLLALPGVIPALLLTADAPPSVRVEANEIYVFGRLPHHLAPLALPAGELITKASRFAALLLAFSFLWGALRADGAHEMATDRHARQQLALLRIFRFATASVVLGLTGLLWHLINWNDPARAASLLKFYWLRLADVAVPLAVSLAIVWLWATHVQRRPKWAAVIAVCALLLPACHLLVLSVNRYQDPRPPADDHALNDIAWSDACNWIRANTPPDALFLTPRSAQSFNWRAERPELVSWKNVPQDARSLIVWRDRHEDLFCYTDADGQRSLYGSLAEQGTAQVERLARRYDVDYVVTKEYPPLQLPIAYRNAGYTVYSVSRRDKAGEE